VSCDAAATAEFCSSVDVALPPRDDVTDDDDDDDDKMALIPNDSISDDVTRSGCCDRIGDVDKQRVLLNLSVIARQQMPGRRACVLCRYQRVTASCPAPLAQLLASSVVLSSSY